MSESVKPTDVKTNQQVLIDDAANGPDSEHYIETGKGQLATLNTPREVTSQADVAAATKQLAGEINQVIDTVLVYADEQMMKLNVDSELRHQLEDRLRQHLESIAKAKINVKVKVDSPVEAAKTPDSEKEKSKGSRASAEKPIGEIYLDRQIRITSVPELFEEYIAPKAENAIIQIKGSYDSSMIDEKMLANYFSSLTRFDDLKEKRSIRDLSAESALQQAARGQGVLIGKRETAPELQALQKQDIDTALAFDHDIWRTLLEVKNNNISLTTAGNSISIYNEIYSSYLNREAKEWQFQTIAS